MVSEDTEEEERSRDGVEEGSDVTVASVGVDVEVEGSIDGGASAGAGVGEWVKVGVSSVGNDIGGEGELVLTVGVVVDVDAGV